MAWNEVSFAGYYQNAHYQQPYYWNVAGEVEQQNNAVCEVFAQEDEMYMSHLQQDYTRHSPGTRVDGGVESGGMASYYEQVNQYSHSQQYAGASSFSRVDGMESTFTNQSGVPMFADWNNQGPTCLDQPVAKQAIEWSDINTKHSKNYFISFEAPQFEVENMEFEFHEDQYEFFNYDFVINIPGQDCILVRQNSKTFLEKLLIFSVFEGEEQKRQPGCGDQLREIVSAVDDKSDDESLPDFEYMEDKHEFEEWDLSLNLPGQESILNEENVEVLRSRLNAWLSVMRPQEICHPPASDLHR